jgi:immune inhibitor A
LARRVLLIVVGILAFSLVAGYGLSMVGIREAMQMVRLEATLSASLATPQPTTAPTIAPTPLPAAPAAMPGTWQALIDTVVPARDSRALAERLRPSGEPIPEVVNPTPPQYAVGDSARFYVSNSDSREVFPITATLRLISQHAQMWVQEGVKVDQRALERAARDFDERIYPTVHEHFGSEWNPGVDNDPRVVILNARFSGAAGYYSSQDEFSRRVNPYSNEREMFYMNVDAAPPGSEHYSGILAHEFQHMVHWHLDPNEDSWVNEGASELATELCGFAVTGGSRSFAQAPDTQLNAWSLGPDDDTLPHYGASYLWMRYIQRRLGLDVLKAVLTAPENGIDAFEKVLKQTPGAPSFDDLYADWVQTNLLDGVAGSSGRFHRQEASIQVAMQTTHRDLPVEEEGTVCQYGTDYIAVTPRSPGLRIEFEGATTTAVVPNRPAQGRYQWWSNRGDMSNTHLTRAFDLSQVSRATLEYSLWYELEDGWDYAYVAVSTDGGSTWTPLTTAHTSDYDPNGNAFGPGYTGYSGHPAGARSRLVPEWVRERVDLTPYVGQEILVRFELVTDDAINLPGLCLDDISLPEIGFHDDAESDDAGWQAEGFVRIDNELPQRFLVQVIEEGKTPRIHRLQLDSNQRGSLTIERLGEDVDRVVLAVSGLTRYTTERASYRYAITPYNPQ